MTADTISQAMWLHLLAARKVRSATELAEALGFTRVQTDRLLYVMAGKGMVRGHYLPGRKNGRGYSVDAACVMPRGMTLQQVLKATGVDVPPAKPIATMPSVPRSPDAPSAPRGMTGHLGRVPSVFAIGAAA